jgi:hypothetical protein
MPPWRVKVKSLDGKVTEVLSDEWKDALSNVVDFRTSGREAWIEDADGRLIDEETGQPKS